MRELAAGLLPSADFSPQAVVMLQEGFKKEKRQLSGQGGRVPGLEGVQLLLTGSGKVPVQPGCPAALGEAAAGVWAEGGHDPAQPGVVIWSRGGASCSVSNSNEALGQRLTCVPT